VWENRLLRGWRVVLPLASTAHRVGPRPNDPQRVARCDSRALDAVTRASHRLAFAQSMPVDSPPLAVRAKGVKDAELLVTSLAIRTEQLLICVEDWGASSVSRKNNWAGLCSHNPSMSWMSN
jgi:hypothetical protein